MERKSFFINVSHPQGPSCIQMSLLTAGRFAGEGPGSLRKCGLLEQPASTRALRTQHRDSGPRGGIRNSESPNLPGNEEACSEVQGWAEF